MNKTTILELQNISLSYDRGKTYIFKDISFSLKKGEILSLIGLNGSGKSSLLKIIAKIQKRYSGTIIRNYKKLSYVPQKIQIDQSFPVSVREFIKIYNNKFLEKHLTEYLEVFDAAKLLYQKTSDLSGGELQKILIISALLGEPEILLLDEPTAGVDMVSEDIFYTIITRLKNYFPDISIIIVSHSIHMVYKYSDNIICLHENNYCCHGTPSELSANKDIEKIFPKYMLPYEHSPHSHSEHIHK